jgi:hypothetical protein
MSSGRSAYKRGVAGVDDREVEEVLDDLGGKAGPRSPRATTRRGMPSSKKHWLWS